MNLHLHLVPPRRKSQIGSSMNGEEFASNPTLLICKNI
jgi:hypothetical protein